MKLLYVADAHLYISNGELYADNQMAILIERYRKAFGEIVLCFRTSNALPDMKSLVKLNLEIKEYVAISNSIKCLLGQNNREITKAVESVDFVVARVPSILAIKAIAFAKEMGKRYLAEVMGCAWDGYWNHGVLGKFFAPCAYWQQRKIVRNANYALYVTNSFLQKRYPCTNPTIGISNVQIDEPHEEQLVLRKAKIEGCTLNRLCLLTVGAVNVRFKGQQYVIRALKKSKSMGLYYEYRIGGYGDQTYLKQMAQKYEVEDQVVFLGALSHDQVLEEMKKCDIYIQPSLQEGLPRTVVEAMSNACPCLGAKTAGIPELLSADCIFERASSDAIVNKLKGLTKANMLLHANENFENSKKYVSRKLDIQRDDFYRAINDDLN